MCARRPPGSTIVEVNDLLLFLRMNQPVSLYDSLEMLLVRLLFDERFTDITMFLAMATQVPSRRR